MTATGLRAAVALWLCAAAVFGCKAEPPKSPTDPKARSIFRELPYRSDPLPDAARIFLIAGGSDIANFAAEVVEQRKLWVAMGRSPDEIACYYAKPTADAFVEDEQQYRRLRHELAGCYAAYPAQVRKHLRQAARKRHPYLYVYFTSHGIDSVLRIGRQSEDPAVKASLRSLSPEERKTLRQYAIGLDADPGPALVDVGAVIAGHRAGTDPDDLVFSPRVLAQALSEFDPAIPKFVVIQACFSGGFVGSDPQGQPHPTLTSVENLTVLTATRYDRPSFGCGAGRVTTFFGGAFNRILSRYAPRKGTPADVPWPQVFAETEFVVGVMESIGGDDASHPRYFSNAPGFTVEDTDSSAAARETTPDPASSPQ